MIQQGILYIFTLEILMRFIATKSIKEFFYLRYNHITASEYGLIHVNSAVITTYHVSWFCLAAFLLLNLVTGAVINNYQIAIDEEDEKKKGKSDSSKE